MTIYRKITKPFSWLVLVSTILWSTGIAQLAPFLNYTVSQAQAATFLAVDQIESMQRIKASATVPALKITFGSDQADQTLDVMRVTLADYGSSGATWNSGGVKSTTLADLGTGAGSGIALYKDSVSTGTAGTFDGEDTIVTLAASPTYASSTAFAITPATAPTIADGDIYFVTLTASSTPASADSFTIALEADGLGNTPAIETSGTDPVIGSTITSDALTIDTTAPTISTAFAEPTATYVTVFFSEFVQTSTVTATSTYTVSGSINVTSVETFGMGTYTDGVRLTLASAATNGATQVTPAAATILDTAGNAMVSAAKTLSQTFPPFITGVKLVDGTTVAVVFDQAMDNTTTDVTARYSITTTAEDTETIDSATLQGDTMTVNVVAGSATIADGDSLAISGINNFQSSAGTPAQGNEYFIIDGTKPYVVGATKVDNVSGDDYVYIRFSERLEFSTSADVGNYTPNTGSFTAAQLVWYNQATSPSWMTPSMSEKVVKLTTADITGMTQVTVSTTVTDGAGNAMNDAGAINVASLAAATAITISDVGVQATLTNGSWSSNLDGCSDNFGDTGNTCTAGATSTRDVIYIPFTGALDTALLGADIHKLISNIGQYVEIFDQWTYGSTQTECVGTDFWNGSTCVGKNYAFLDTSMGEIVSTEANDFTTDTNGVANDVLLIYLQGSANVWNNMQVNPVGIKGLNGLNATQNATPSKNVIPQPTFAEVQFVKVVKAGASYADGDTVSIFFNSDMRRSDIATSSTAHLVAKIKPTSMMPWAEHSWGTGGSLAVAWGNHDGATCTADEAGQADATADCLEITLGGSPTVVEGDEIHITSVNSNTGLPIGYGGTVDSTAPTVVQSVWNSSSNVLTLQYNEELVDVSGDDLSTHGIVFTDDNSGGVTIASVATVTDCTGGDGWCPFKKIAITFSGAIEDNDDINFSSANIINEGGLKLPNITNLTVASYVDAIAPTLCRMIQNDWDGNGTLNAQDEVTIRFDNESPAASGNGCVSDIDYSTVTDPNTDFVVKRSGVAVSNAFGQGAGTWIDQWDQYAGDLHINLGMGADIRPGDEIWAAENEIADTAGNYMVSDAAQLTIASVRGGEIAKVVFTDTDSSTTLTDGDTFAVTFNTEIDATTLGTLTGATVTNLDWGLPIEHNFDANYGTVYSYAMKTWGANSTGSWNTATTTLTITIDCSSGDDATLCDHVDDASFEDTDMIRTWSVQTAAGGRVHRPGTIDFSAPTLTIVFGNKAADGAAASWGAGDKLIFMFSEPMDETTFVLDTLATMITRLGGVNFGDGAVGAFADPENRVLEVTLGATGLAVTDESTFDPTNDVKDLNGIADATASAVAITLSAMSGPTSVSATDADTINPGIDGRDMTVTFNSVTGATQYKIYVLPNFVTFNSSTHNPIGLAGPSICTGSSCSYTASVALNTDSRSTDAAGDLDTSKPFFPLNEFDDYFVFVIATDGTNDSFPSRSSSPLEFGIEYGADGFPPFIKGSQPFNGAVDVPINSKKISVKFNEEMSRATVEASGNIALQSKVIATGAWSNVSAYVSYDAANFSANIEAAANLSASTEYRVLVSTGVTDKGGTAIASSYETHLTTSASSDSTAPKVSTYFFDGSTLTGAGLTTVTRDTFSISIVFDEDMDPSTFNTTNITLSPSVANSTVAYDPFFRSMNYVLGGSLASSTAYTLTASGVYVKDVAGNTLDGDGNGTGAGTTSDNYTLSFTSSGAALSQTQPTIDWIDSNSGRINVGFSQKMDKAAAENKRNWTLKRGATVVDLQTATFFFDGYMNELRIEGISLTSGSSYTLTPNSSVLAISGQAIDTSGSSLEFVPVSDAVHFNATTIDTFGAGIGGDFTGSFNGGMFSKMGGENAANDFDVKTFMPISVWPSNQTASKTSNYHINFPTTKAIANGGKIILEFPASFNVTSAAVARDGSNKLFFFNQDINGPGGTMTAATTFDQDGKVQIVSVSANNQTKQVTLTIAVDDGTGCTLDASSTDETPVSTGVQNASDNSIYGEFMSTCTDTNQTSTTMQYDFIDFELSGIVNGSASSVDWFNDTGGYQVSITTKDATNKALEGPIKSMRFDIKKAGSGSISGAVTASDGITAVASARVYLDSPLAGHQETTTDSSGNYSFTQLPVAKTSDAWDGWYHIWVESPLANDNYFGGQSFDIQLTSTSPTSSGNNVTLSSAANTITYTITHTGDELDNKDVQIWAGGQTGWKEKLVTLDADGSTSATLKVSNGFWDLGVMPYMDRGSFGGGPVDQDFMPPKPVQKNITGDDSVTIALTTSGLTVSGVVTDGTSGLANVHVYAYDPSGTSGGGGTETGTDGSYKLKVAAGTYIIGANKPGLPSVKEQTVTVSNANITGINFSMNKPTSSISGRVSDGTNAIQYAGVNAWTNDGQHAWASTDSQGEYILFLSPGTWSLEASAPGYGHIDAASGVTATGISVTAGSSVTGKNFSLSDTTFYTITGQVKDGNSNGIANVFVQAESAQYVNGILGAFTGSGNGAKTDSTGNYSIKVKANTAGTGSTATRYQLHAWNPDYGDLKPDSSTVIDVSAGSSASNDFTVPTKRAMTISIVNGDQIEDDTGSDPYDIVEAFVDVFSTTSDIGNHKRFKNTELTAGANSSVGTVNVPQAGGYIARLHIPGVGEFTGTLSGQTTFSINANGTLQFDLGLNTSGSVLTFSGTTKDEGATAVSDAWVSVTNSSTFATFGTASAGDGTYSIKVPTGTYVLRADKPGYKSASEVTLTADDSSRVLTLTTSGSTISGTVKSSAGVAVTRAFVWAEEVSGGGWVGDEVDTTDGTFSLPVPESTSWKLYAQDESGNAGANTTAVAAGRSGQIVTLNKALAGASHISNQSKVESMTPSSGGVMDDTSNTGVKLTVPERALGTDSNPGQIVSRETAKLPKTTQVEPFGGVGKEITATDSSGAAITSLNGDVTVELMYDKDETESYATANASASENGLEELDNLTNSYWDTTTQTWVPMSTTKSVKVKDAADDAGWTVVDFTTFFTNVTGEGTNSSGDGGSGMDYYADYQISMTSTTDHFTIFAPTAPGDSEAPAAPSGLTVSSAISGIVSLSWSENSEVDLLEYELYRSASSGFTCGDATQINTSSVTGITYTDSTVDSSAYTYYYKISAADTSGNESSCSAEVTATYAPTGGVLVVPTTGGSSPSTTTTTTTTTTATTTTTTTTTATTTDTAADSSSETTTADTDAETTGDTSSVGEEQAVPVAAVDSNIVEVRSDAAALLSGLESLLARVHKVRNQKREQTLGASIISRIIPAATQVAEQVRARITEFVTYGSPTTDRLGEGERGGVVDSFRSAFNKLPETQADWEDVVKIANGRWPSQRNEAWEDRATRSFRAIYLREPDRTNPHDDAAVVVMAYGLRPRDRNLESERIAIRTYERIFGRAPSSASAWDAVRAIAYSGATR